LEMNSVVSNNRVRQKSEGQNTIDGGGDSVNQSGEKNFYTKNNSGGINIKM